MNDKIEAAAADDLASIELARTQLILMLALLGELRAAIVADDTEAQLKIKERVSALRLDGVL